MDTTTDDPEQRPARTKAVWNWLTAPKRIAIILGTLMAILGSAGQFFFVETLSAQSAGIQQSIARSRSAIESLKAAQIQYFFTFQQGSMLFAMDPNGTTRDKEVLGKLYALNLINRATPLRTLLGDMAIAGVLDYRKTYDAYSALNEKARAEFTWDNYAALNTFEQAVIDGALQRQHKLDEDILALESRKAALEETIDRRKLFLVLMSLFGTLLLLFANLRSIN